MNHSFIPSIGSADVCAKCKFPYIAHTDNATCECCPRIGPVEIRYGNMLMCDDCWQTEQSTSAANMTPEKQQERVDALNQAIEKSREIDSSIQVRTDLFNAATIAIVELKKAIDDNPEITNKPYALAEELTNRFKHFQSTIFDYNEKIVEMSNNQKAIQVYLNNLANQLRVEEREKLKLADINYKPGAITPKVKPVSTTGRKSNKLDKVELAKYAKELGISEFTLQMLVISKGITVETAANMIRKSLEAAKTNQ